MRRLYSRRRQLITRTNSLINITKRNNGSITLLRSLLLTISSISDTTKSSSRTFRLILVHIPTGNRTQYRHITRMNTTLTRRFNEHVRRTFRRRNTLTTRTVKSQDKFRLEDFLVRRPVFRLSDRLRRRATRYFWASCLSDRIRCA